MARVNTKDRTSRAIFDLVRLLFVATARANVDPASVAAEASGDTTITVTGALLGDFVLLSMETDRITGVNAAIHAFVSAADTVTLHVTNNTVAAGAAIDIAATNMQVTVLRRG